MKRTAIVIPSLEPDEKLLSLLKAIRDEESDTPVILVNDGSAPIYDSVFEAAQNRYACILLKHEVNRGKGAALKTAITYILERMPEIDFMITIDSDGQHQYKDMVNCVRLAEENPEALVLGCRQFDKDVPFRSKFGNIVTRHILRLATGIAIEDTQTGLRVIPRSFMAQLLETKGDRFEFETYMLLDAKEQGVPILSQTIDTIYLEDNASSHFRVIADSLSIYSIFFKYILSSIFCFLVDALMFAIIAGLLATVSLSATMIATICARIISSLLNYYINREHVFSANSENSMIKYFTLVVVQMMASGLLVYLCRLALPAVNVVLIKIVVDCFLFCVSYHIQKKYIF